MKLLKNMNQLGLTLLMLLINNKTAHAFNPIEIAQFSTTKSIKIAQNSQNLYDSFSLSGYPTCGVASAYWEWTQTTNWWKNASGKIPISYTPTINFSYGTSSGSVYDSAGGPVGNSWPWDNGFGNWYARSDTFLTNWTVTSNSYVYLNFPAPNMFTANTTSPYILSGKVRVAMVCPSTIPLALPTSPTFVSNVIDHNLGSYTST